MELLSGVRGPSSGFSTMFFSLLHEGTHEKSVVASRYLRLSTRPSERDGGSICGEEKMKGDMQIKNAGCGVADSNRSHHKQRQPEGSINLLCASSVL